MTMFEAAEAMETGEIRMKQTHDMLTLILDDLGENDINSDAGRVLLSHRFPLYINTLHVLLSVIASIEEELHDAASACFTTAQEQDDKRYSVLAEFHDLAVAGVDLCALFHSLGYNTLADIPPEKMDGVLNQARQEVEKVQKSAKN